MEAKEMEANRRGDDHHCEMTTNALGNVDKEETRKIQNCLYKEKRSTVSGHINGVGSREVGRVFIFT